MKLLHIDSSITGSKSISRQLSGQIVRRLIEENPAIDVTYYDLDTAPFAYLSSAAFIDPAQQAEGERAIRDFQEADVIVIGAPMYNFSVPAQLKGWIDRIAVAGKTFRYTANGPEGLSGGKRVIIASVRGGFYNAESGLAALDHQEAYLKTVFGFLGVTDIEFVRAEGVNISPDVAAKSIAAAEQEIKALTPEYA